MKKLFLIIMWVSLLGWDAKSQTTEAWSQINYEDLTPQIMSTLNDEIAKMNLDFILFNFYKHTEAPLYPVEFLRQGVDITTLGGLEFIIFNPDGSINEKRYKYYSDELLISTPLEMIMTMQEKTKNHELNYLTKIELSSGEASYRAITADSTFVFNERMEYLHALAVQKAL